MMIGYRGSTQKCSSVPIVLMQQRLSAFNPQLGHQAYWFALLSPRHEMRGK
jgi:hypothetical protein